MSDECMAVLLINLSSVEEALLAYTDKRAGRSNSAVTVFQMIMHIASSVVTTSCLQSFVKIICGLQRLKSCFNGLVLE